MVSSIIKTNANIGGNEKKTREKLFSFISERKKERERVSHRSFVEIQERNGFLVSEYDVNQSANELATALVQHCWSRAREREREGGEERERYDGGEREPNKTAVAFAEAAYNWGTANTPPPPHPHPLSRFPSILVAL